MAAAAKALGLLLALLAGAGPAAALERQAWRPSKAALQAAAKRGLYSPSEESVAKMRPAVRSLADGLLRRVIAKLAEKIKVPNLPAVVRWELVTQLTRWMMERYQRPRRPSDQAMLDKVLGLASPVFAADDFASASDAEVLNRLVEKGSQAADDVARWADERHAPPSVAKLITRFAEARRERPGMDGQGVVKLIIDVANETTGPALAELMDYGRMVINKDAGADSAKALDMEAQLFTQLGTPPAVEEYLRTSADRVRQKVDASDAEEGARLSRMLAVSSAQLQMPQAVSDFYDYVADVLGNSTVTHIFEDKQETDRMLGHLNHLVANVSDQLAGPPAAGQLIRYLGNGRHVDMSGIMTFLGTLVRETNMPKAVQDASTYLGFVAGGLMQREPEREALYIAELAEELGGPEPYAEVHHKLETLAWNNTPASIPQILHMVKQLLQKIEMPALAGIVGDVIGPMVENRTMPNAISLAATLPNMMKVLPELEAGNEMVRGMRAKLLSPLLPFYETAMDKLTGGMGENFAKSAFKKVFSVVKPPATTVDM